MRYLIALALMLGGCATGTPGGGGGDDGDDGPSIDANPTIDPPDADTTVDPPDAEPPPDAMSGSGEVTAQEFLCNDGFDNDGDGQTDCAEATCAWVCTALMAACAAPNQLRGYTLTPMPQTINDNSTLNATVAVAQSGAIVLAAVRFNATHTWDSDIDLTITSPGGTTLDLTSDNGSLMANFTNTVFIDSATTPITSGSAPYTGNFNPEQPLSGLTTQSITGTWTATLADDASSDTGTWTELSIGLCADPP